ncbi:hypothetical protein ABW19_dt0201528 [Dactylella cylindrospora]|nr:hypothetical protein ABW19_dt0201528 [Dactylella cylindrospora]
MNKNGGWLIDEPLTPDEAPFLIHKAICDFPDYLEDKLKLGPDIYDAATVSAMEEVVADYEYSGDPLIISKTEESPPIPQEIVLAYECDHGYRFHEQILWTEKFSLNPKGSGINPRRMMTVGKFLTIYYRRHHNKRPCCLTEWGRGDTRYPFHHVILHPPLPSVYGEKFARTEPTIEVNLRCPSVWDNQDIW